MNKQDQITKTIKDATEKFSSSIPYIEKKILKELMLLIKDLEVDSSGNIKQTSRNITLVSNIRKKLEKIVFSKAYVKDVTEFTNNFLTITSLQDSLFEFKPSSFAKKVTKTSIDYVIESLTESGINAQVIDPIRKVLINNVSVGGSYQDMTEYLREQLAPTEGKGILSKYIGTIATDSINTFSRTYNSIMSDAAGYEWFTYRNSLKETSREFCIHMVEKRYFHKSEIPELLEGKVDGHQCRIYEATGLPYGMKADTNETNFLMYAGGWNCGHQIIGVPESIVPKSIVEKFKNKNKDL